MGYQALLFCPDEKLARVVAQVFTELDFHVEPVNEPFAAVKKLMAQRYDAVVVDCENEQNATLLFKSARNSSFNQSSLALALVEGQAGVAKAYRIGANLVLTKPINVEQAKGTLRVARGLLRKNADSAAPSTSSAAAPAATSKANAAPIVSASRPHSPIAGPVVNASNAFEEIGSALPAMAASAKNQESPIMEPAPWSKIPVNAEPTIQFQHQSAAPEPPKPVVAAPIVSAPVQKSVPSTAMSQGAAAAPAPAKEAHAPAEKSRRSLTFSQHGTPASQPPVRTKRWQRQPSRRSANRMKQRVPVAARKFWRSSRFWWSLLDWVTSAGRSSARRVLCPRHPLLRIQSQFKRPLHR